MAGRDLPPVGGNRGPGQPGRYPVGYQGNPAAGPVRTAGQRPAGAPGHGAGQRPGYQAYERGPGGPDPRQRPGHPGGRGPSGYQRYVNYPRFGRTGWRHWVPSWKLVAGLFGTFFLMGVLAFSIAYAVIDIPKQQVAVPQTTIFYYSNNKEIGRLAEQNRQSVEFVKMSKTIVPAVVAAEDASFFENAGVSPTGILRAAWSNARGGGGGGSTITQQYVKNLYKGQTNRSYSTKFKEFFIALKIGQQKSKEEILEGYLNAIYFGRGAYGAQAAAQAYFGVDVDKLNPSQAAYLAGIANSPNSASHPEDGGRQLERATFRWSTVLSAMTRNKPPLQLSQADYGKYYAKGFPKVKDPKSTGSLSGQKGYLITMAQLDAAKRLGTTKEKIETGGYAIYTTFDQSLIKEATEAVKTGAPGMPKNKHVGLASIDPRSGAVRAIYGGRDYIKNQWNNATDAIAQGGSTFKAFGLVAALEDDVSLTSRYKATSPMKIKGYPVNNFERGGPAYRTLLDATKHSTNTVFVQVNAKDDRKEKLRQAAIDAGLPKDTAGLEDNLVNVLGTASPHAIDMATAYATFAAQGIRHETHSVAKITQVGSAKAVWTEDDLEQVEATKAHRVFKADVMADLTYALQQPVSYGGTGAYAASFGSTRPIAGKTGTSNESVSAWFVGYTPQLATAVMMYQGKGGSTTIDPWGGVSSITGGSYPVRIWTDFMRNALQGKPVIDFPERANLGEFEGVAPPQTYDPQPSQPTDPGTEPSATVDPQPTEDPGGGIDIPIPGQDDGQQQQDPN